ncbi:methyltransferase [Methylomonas sp. UP202]|uniref:methyltransferase n=1 Tax=Methylomonas sp. UP202 TaxID=3040943 RepID=UPI00247A4719|nr:methyltransferase [Methylomonas sp. UP202]WGS87159.1 methyltransferase [Methylomonas sp. UP202]
MKEELSFEELALIAGGHTAFQLLWAGVQLKLFDFLSEKGPISGSDIQMELGLAPQPTRILLIGLTALRLVKKDGNLYRNSPIVEQLLVSHSEDNMIDILGWQNFIVYPGEMDFVESLRQNKNIGLNRFQEPGDTLYARLSNDPGLEIVFHNAMQSLSNSANRLLMSSVNFNNIKHIVDAGGGSGENSIKLATSFPHMKVTIFDNPTVCEIARQNIIKSDVSGRVSVYPGDFFKDDFPKGIDCVFLGHIMTIWSIEKGRLLLKKIYNALPKEGKVIIFNMMGNDDDSGPIVTALGSPYFLTIATGEGMLYSWSDYENLLIEAGFHDISKQILPKEHGVIIGCK